MKTKNIILIAVLVLVVGAIFYLESQKTDVSGPVVRQEILLPTSTPSSAHVSSSVSMPERSSIIAEKAKNYPRAIELAGITGFINTPTTTTLASLIGKKVILVDFWTYSCINCIRTLPYLESWYEKYKDKGFVIVGIHTPEFDFEKNYQNVSDAVKRFGITYPVVLDSNRATWSAYDNQFWPAEYLIDIDGFVVHKSIGEGGYAEHEIEIQQALAERMSVLGKNDTVSLGVSNPKDVTTVDSSQLGSPEVYFGWGRNEYLGNGIVGGAGTQTLEYPATIKPNTLYLSGTWNFDDQFAENANAGAKIKFQYRAKSVYIVGSSAQPVALTILRDGVPLGAEAGKDVHSGKVTVQEDRLYELINDPAGYGMHTIEIIIEKSGFKAFTFTFG